MNITTDNLRKVLYRLPLIQKLGLRLIFGLFVTICCSALFFQIAEDVLEKDKLVAFDVATANALHAAATPTSTGVFEAISWLGLPGVLIIGVVVGVYYLAKRQRLYLAAWIFGLVGGLILNSALKLIFARDRPYFVDPLVIEQNFSFPSGHAMLSLIGYGLLTYFLVNTMQNNLARFLLILGMGLLVILIGVSRVTLGVHYLSDVVAGFAAGGVWLTTCFIAISTIHRQRRRTALNSPEDTI